MSRQSKESKESKVRRTFVILAACLLGLGLLLVGSLTMVLSTRAGTGWALSQLLNQVNNLPGQQVTVASSEGTLVSGLQLQGLEYHGAAARVVIDQARISWNPFSLMSARLSVSEISFSRAHVELLTPNSPADQPDQPAGPVISFTPLPVDVELGSISVRQLIVQQSQQQFNIEELSVSARLQEQLLELSSLSLKTDSIQLLGDLALVLRDNAPIDAEFHWQFNDEIYIDSGPASGTLTLTGDLASLELQHQLDQPIALTSRGSIQTGLDGNQLAINLSHNSDSISLPQTPIEELVLGNLELTTIGDLASLQIALTTTVENALTPATSLALNAIWQSDTLLLQNLQLTTSTGQLNASGELLFAETLAGTLRYQLADESPLNYIDSSLPLDILDLSSSGEVEFSLVEDSLQGTLQLSELSGEFGDYPFNGLGSIRYIDDALYVENVQLSTEDNSLAVEGVLADNLDLNWQVAAPQINQFIADLTGELQASGQVTGNLKDLQLVANISASAVNYNGLFVDTLQLSLQRQGQTIQGLLAITDAGIETADRTDKIQSLTLQVDGTDAQHLWSLATSTDHGDIELELQGGFTDLSTLSWDGVLQQGRLNSYLGEWLAASGNPASFNTAVNATPINLANSCWQQGNAEVCVSVAADNPPEGLTLQLDGQVSNYPLTTFNNQNQQVDETAPLPDTLPRLPEMVSVAGFVDAILSLQIDSRGDLSAAANLQPRDAFLTIRSTEADTEGETYAEIDPGTSAAIEPESATDSDELNYSEQSYALLDPQITVTLENGSWNLQAGTHITGSSESDESDSLSGVVNSQLRVSPGGELTGNLQADLGGIGWLEAFSQDIDNLAGSLTGNILFSGTIDEPQFGVDVQLADGQVTVLPLGITIDQVVSNITSLDDGSIQLTTSAHSGGGSLQLQGLLLEPFSSRRSLQAQVSGADFRLAEIPDLNLVVTPEVTINADDQKIDIAGSLRLPTLVVNLVQLPETAVDISRDAVIIDYPVDQPQLARSIASEQSTLFNLPVIADLDISLGEQVSFNGFGLTTDVAGNLNVRQQENGTNLTYGELEIVSGQYTLYGRSLQIRQGKLLFFGAYDNPALDIRATREVESNTVGVLMNGTLKNIHSQLFSTPALPDSDIIAILITGKPFSEIGQGEGTDVVGAIANLGLSRSQGLTNQVREQLGLDTLAITNTGNINNSILTVGKYLTPDLFIRYGIGLFDHQSKLALDYTLSEHITLQAETGEYQSVDLIYRVER